MTGRALLPMGMNADCSLWRRQHLQPAFRYHLSGGWDWLQAVFLLSETNAAAVSEISIGTPVGVVELRMSERFSSVFHLDIMGVVCRNYRVISHLDADDANKCPTISAGFFRLLTIPPRSARQIVFPYGTSLKAIFSASAVRITI